MLSVECQKALTPCLTSPTKTPEEFLKNSIKFIHKLYW